MAKLCATQTPGDAWRQDAEQQAMRSAQDAAADDEAVTLQEGMARRHRQEELAASDTRATRHRHPTRRAPAGSASPRRQPKQAAWSKRTTATGPAVRRGQAGA
jgi:hypothetical protein